jgi:hypothetical protein
VEIDANGKRLLLDDGEVEGLIARASAEAGRSSACRDLAILLRNRSSSHRPLVLRRYEAQTLAALLGEQSAA